MRSLGQEVKGVFNDRVHDLALVIFVSNGLVEAAGYESSGLRLKEGEGLTYTGKAGDQFLEKEFILNVDFSYFLAFTGHGWVDRPKSCCDLAFLLVKESSEEVQ